MMTREEAIEEFRHSIAMSKLDLKVNKKNMSIEREIMVLNSITRNEMAIKALEQNEGLENMVKMGIAKDCESCKIHRVEVLDKIRAEISKAWYTHPKSRYQEGLKDQALKDMKIIDKYKAQMEGEIRNAEKINN